MEPRRRAIELSQGRLHVVELGPETGTPVLFLHGVLANGRLWEHSARLLAPRHRCLIPDLPLGAHSEALGAHADLSPSGVVRMLGQLLDALGVESVHLVGNDSGGALCQLFLVAFPERVRSVTFTSSDAYDVWLPWLFKPLEFAAFVPGALFVVSQLLRWRWVRRLPFALGWLSRRMPDELSDSFVLPFARSSGVRRDVARFLRGISPRLTRAAALHFSSFRKPVLVAWSRDDRFFSAALGQRLADAFPNSRLSFIEDSYTFSPVDQPEQLAAKLEDFLCGFS